MAYGHNIEGKDAASRTSIGLFEAVCSKSGTRGGDRGGDRGCIAGGGDAGVHDGSSSVGATGVVWGGATQRGWTGSGLLGSATDDGCEVSGSVESGMASEAAAAAATTAAGAPCAAAAPAGSTSSASGAATHWPLSVRTQCPSSFAASLNVSPPSRSRATASASGESSPAKAPGEAGVAGGDGGSARLGEGDSTTWGGGEAARAAWRRRRPLLLETPGARATPGAGPAGLRRPPVSKEAASVVSVVTVWKSTSVSGAVER